MEGRRFDDLTRRLTATLNRRRVMASLLGVAGAAALGSGAEARVRCRAYDASCTRSAQCCSAYCETSRQAARRRRNRCSCPPGLGWCDGACVDLTTKQNCGSCGNVCPGATSLCVSGACVCPDDRETLCSDGCVDTNVDFDHCGGCGQACPDSADFCGLGVCRAKEICSDSIVSPQSGDACVTLANGSYSAVSFFAIGDTGSEVTCAVDEDCPPPDLGYTNSGCVLGVNVYAGGIWYWSDKRVAGRGWCYYLDPLT